MCTGSPAGQSHLRQSPPTVTDPPSWANAIPVFYLVFSQCVASPSPGILAKDPSSCTKHKPRRLALEVASQALGQLSSWWAVENKGRAGKADVRGQEAEV